MASGMVAKDMLLQNSAVHRITSPDRPGGSPPVNVTGVRRPSAPAEKPNRLPLATPYSRPPSGVSARSAGELPGSVNPAAAAFTCRVPSSAIARQVMLELPALLANAKRPPGVTATQPVPVCEVGTFLERTPSRPPGANPNPDGPAAAAGWTVFPARRLFTNVNTSIRFDPLSVTTSSVP